MTVASRSEPKRVSRSDYGRQSRFYEVETESGEKVLYPSVTTVLQVIAKPALLGWAAKVERTLCIETAAQLYDDTHGTPKMSRVAYMASLEKRLGATKAHTRELEKAGDIGTGAHALIEWTMRKECGQKVGPEPIVSQESLIAFHEWQNWRESRKLKPRLIEQVVYSHEHCFAGTMDVFAEITVPELDGPVMALGDWKTGRAIYPESTLQNAAYMAALVEMNHARDFSGGFVVRLPKKVDDPGFEEKLLTPQDQREAFAVFLRCLELWNWMEGQGKP